MEMGSGVRRLVEVCPHWTSGCMGMELHHSGKDVMIALLIGASTLIAIGVAGWYGYRAYCRIQEWGRRMNEIDRIFQYSGEHVDHREFVRGGAPARPGFRAGPAASK